MWNSSLTGVMHRLSVSIRICLFLLLMHAARAGAVSDVYLSPLPSATLVSKDATIIFRPIDTRFRDAAGVRFDVSGTMSGACSGEVVVSDDGVTTIFKPYRSFIPGESVAVTIRAGADKWAYEFTVSPQRERPRIPYLPEDAPWAGFEAPPADVPRPAEAMSPVRMRGRNYNLPEDFPNMAVTTLDNPAPGLIFMVNMRPFMPGATVQPYMIILGNDGVPVYFRKNRAQLFNQDLRVQPATGLLTYFDRYISKYYAMDSTYSVVDSFKCGNGYDTDFHELVVMPNNHALLMSYDPQPVDMSQVVAGGDSSATVIGLVVQEIDVSKNVVFQWRSWDHVQITDSYAINLTAANVDYIHGNAISPTVDGNLLVSCRHFDQVMKIDRMTGEFIWRMGGKNNEFTFVNDISDTTGFWRQHDIRMLPNGNITLFDNGNFHTPPYSRGVEYQLDEPNRTATRVWEYRNSPDNYGFFMGNVQRLPDGGSVIGWGGSNPNVTEVHADGTKAFELTLDSGVFNYRAYRYPWSGTATRPTMWEGEFDRSRQALTLYFDKFGDDQVDRYVLSHEMSARPTTRVDSTTENAIEVSGLVPNAPHYFRVRAIDNAAAESPFSNEVGFAFPNDAPSSSQLVSPPDGTALEVDSTLFVWTTAADPDSDAVSYHIHFMGEWDVMTESVTDTFVVFDISTLAAGQKYRWTAITEDFAAGTASADTFTFTTPAPDAVQLYHNFPNPFNPATTIPYDLPEDAFVTIRIYNVLGQEVRMLINDAQTAGFREVVWDGTDNAGHEVGSGIYFCRLTTGGIVRTRKMVFVK